MRLFITYCYQPLLLAVLAFAVTHSSTLSSLFFPQNLFCSYVFFFFSSLCHLACILYFCSFRNWWLQSKVLNSLENHLHSCFSINIQCKRREVFWGFLGGRILFWFFPSELNLYRILHCFLKKYSFTMSLTLVASLFIWRFLK